MLLAVEPRGQFLHTELNFPVSRTELGAQGD